MICGRCKVEFETLRCDECPLCEAVSKVMVVIFSRWNPDEIEELAKSIRGNTIQNLIRETEGNGSYMLAHVCRLIRHLGHSVPQGADYLKTRVCDALMKQSAHEASCAKWQRDNGVSYQQSRKMLSLKIGESWKEAAAKFQ